MTVGAVVAMVVSDEPSALFCHGCRVGGVLIIEVAIAGVAWQHTATAVTLEPEESLCYLHNVYKFWLLYLTENREALGLLLHAVAVFFGYVFYVAVVAVGELIVGVLAEGVNAITEGGTHAGVDVEEDMGDADDCAFQF